MSTQATELDTAVDELTEVLDDHVDVDESDIRDELTNLVKEYQVPLDEARRSVINSHTEDTDVDPSDISRGGGDADVLVNDIEKDEEWVNVEVKVDDLWEPRSDSISQVGLVGDDSGKTKFTAFETSDLALLEEGQSYRLENVVSEEYEGDINIKLNSRTEIIELDEEVEIGDNTVTMAGVLASIASDSGLIKRCPEEECTYVLSEGRCDAHGPQDEHEFDLRIKGTVDNGVEAHDIIINQEVTEELTGMSLSEAQEIAKDKLEITAVREQFKDDLVGQYLTLQATPYKGNNMINEFEFGVETDDVDSLLVRARSI